MPDGAIGRSGVGGRWVLPSAGAKESKCEEIKSDKKHGKEWVCPILSYLCEAYARRSPDAGQWAGADIIYKSVYLTLVLDLQKSGSF